MREHIFNIHVVNLLKLFYVKGIKKWKTTWNRFISDKGYQNNKFKGFDKQINQIGFFEEGTLKYGKLKEESKISIGEFKMVIGPHVPLYIELVNGVERNDEMRTSLYYKNSKITENQQEIKKIREDIDQILRTKYNDKMIEYVLLDLV